MLPDVHKDLFELLESRGVAITPDYKSTVLALASAGLSYNTPAMYGMAHTLFQNKEMIAYNLIQNAIDEAKGAARVNIIAERYAPASLKKKMKRHVADELRHSRQFAKLLRLTGYKLQTDGSQDAQDTVTDVFEFDDELKTFLARVHSIEIRSWTMLRHYIAIIGDLADESMHAAIPVLKRIMADEVNHVTYTGEQVNLWLAEDPSYKNTVEACFLHTNRETWHDLANMSNYLADNLAETVAV